MSDVLEYFRSKDPRFKKVPDEELTRYVGERFPQFQEDDEFYQDFTRVTMSPEDKAQMESTEKKADLLAEQKKERKSGEYWEGVEQRIDTLTGTTVEPLSRPISGAFGRGADAVVSAVTGQPQPSPESPGLTESALMAPTIKLPKAGDAYGSEVGGKITAGAHDAIAGLVGMFSSPDALLLLPAAANKAVLAAWISQMAGHQPERVLKATELLKEGKVKEGAQEIVTGIAELGMAELGRRHVMAEPKVAAPIEIAARQAENNLAPATAEALRLGTKDSQLGTSGSQITEPPKGGQLETKVEAQKEVLKPESEPVPETPAPTPAVDNPVATDLKSTVELRDANKENRAETNRKITERAAQLGEDASTSLAWLESSSRSDTEAIRNAEKTILGESEKTRGIPYGDDTGRTKASSSSSYGGGFEKEASQVGARPPYQQEYHGQPRGESFSYSSRGTHDPTPEVAARQVVDSLRLLREMPNTKEAAHGARVLHNLLSKASEETKAAIVQSIREIVSARKSDKPVSEQLLTETPESINTGELGERGMGGAKPGEFAPARELATGIKNAAVDAERQARGQPPIMKAERVGNEVVWDRVMARIDREPEWQERLIEELTKNPRSATADEVLALDHRYVDYQNEYAKATRDGAQAYKDGYEIGVEEAKNRAAFYESKLNELEQVVRKIGTEAGRAFQMRQRLMKEDFTLEAMEAKARAAKGFEPLTEAEHVEIRNLHEKLAAAEARATEVEARSNERISMLEVQKALAEAKANTATGPAYEPRVLQAAEKFAKFMDRKGEEALSRLKERLGRTSAGVDPTILSDVSILGAAKITRGVVEFAKWTDAMAKDLGEWFREHAQEAWDASQKQFTDNLDGFQKGVDKATTEKVRRKLTDIPGRITDAKDSIKAKMAKGEGSPLHGEVRKLVKLLVESDPKITRDGLIDAVREVLKETNPEITRLEAMDAISGRGKFWTPDQAEVAKTVRDLSAQIRLVGHQMDVQAGKPMPRTGYQPDKMSEAASKEQKKLNELIRKYGLVVKDPATQLGSILQGLKTRLEREKAELTERLERGDFSPRRKVRDFPLDKEAADARGEVLLLREKFQQGLAKQRYQNKSRAEKIWLGTKEALNLSRALMTSWDVSAVLRQGGFIALGNPVRAAKAMAPMFRALASEKKAAAVEAEIRSRPNAKLYEQSKLFLAERDGKLTGMEEAFMSRLASKIPGVGASGRAYVTFLNRLRADTFDALHESLVSGKEATPAELQAISNYINVATGRGNLGKAAGAAETLSTVFFAPRLVASRFQLLAGEPMYRGSAQSRYLIAKEYAKFLTGVSVVLGLGMLSGADVESDPRSSDFGKMKFGNTRLDPMAGLSQTAVISSRLATGEMKTSRGKVKDIRGEKVDFGSQNSADLIARFLRTKLNPVIGNTVDALTGKNVVGETVTAGSVAQNMVTPLAMRDIYDVMIEQGIPKGTAISLLSLLGMSVQNYDEKKKAK